MFGGGRRLDFAARYGVRRWAKAALAGDFVYRIAAPDTLITTGPYAYLVHPSYTGMLLHLAGIIMLGAVGLSQT